MGYVRGSQLFLLTGRKGPKTVQRLMLECQMNTITLCVSMYIEADQEPNKNGLRAAFGPRAAI